MRHAGKCAGKDEMKAGIFNKNLFAITVILMILSSGCGIMGRKKGPGPLPVLTINRLWEMHRDIDFAYFYYADGSVESGLLLKWEKERIEIQKKGRGVPEYISSKGIERIKVVVGNRIWSSLIVGAAAGAACFFLVKGYDLGGQSSGTAIAKMFSAPLIIMASVAYGASKEKTVTYLVPENFSFDYDEIKQIHRITE